MSVNYHFEGEYKVAFKREQRVLAHFAEHSNQKELNAKITLSDSFFSLHLLRGVKLFLSLRQNNLTTQYVL